MAGEKLSARQKMIGMMYLVLTALLALQVSSSVLDKFVLINKSLEKSISKQEAQNIARIQQLKKVIEETGNRAKDIAVLEMAADIRTKTHHLITYINQIKDELIDRTGGQDPKTGRLKGIKDDAGVAQLMCNEKKATELKHRLNGYMRYLTQSIGKPYKDIALDAKDSDLFKDDPNQQNKCFSTLNFEKSPLGASLATLSQFGTDVIYAESDALETLGGKIGSDDVKFDKVFPLIKPQSNIVAAGTKYDADLLLAASSSAFEPEMLVDNKAIPVDSGIGKISFMTTPGKYDENGLARKTFKAAIKLKVPGGDSTFMKEVEYFVAKPVIQVQSAAVSALYLNAGNELNIHVPALGINYQPKFTAEGAVVLPGQGKGLVTLIPNAPEVKLAVYNHNSLLDTITFKVRTIPKPTIQITSGGKPLNERQGMPAPGPRRLEIKALADEGFKVFLPKDARYRVAEWEVTLARGSRPIQTKKITSQEVNLSDFAAAAQPGDRIVIEVKKVERLNYKEEIETVNLGTVRTFNPWTILLISTLTLSVSPSQVLADDPGVVKEDLSATNTPKLAPSDKDEQSTMNAYMSYNKNSLYSIPEAAIIFRTRIWREIYLKERKNKPFFSKNKEITKLIIDGVKEGKLTPYQDETLAETMTNEQFITNLRLPAEEVLSEQEKAMGFGEEQANWGDKKSTTTSQQAEEPIADEFLPTEVTTLELMEDLIFDKRTSSFIHDIQTIKLIIPADKFPTGLRRTVGTFKYKDLVAYFNSKPTEAVWVNVQNDAALNGHLQPSVLGISPLELPAVPEHKKIFFASDFHLGHQSGTRGRLHEHHIIQWLSDIKSSTHALFLLGDIFDFWFEYQHVVPKGFIRLQHKLATFTEQQIPVYFLLGNRDCWAKDYFEKELGITLLHDTTLLFIEEKKLLIGHGDGFSGGTLYRLLKKHIYQNPIFRSMVNLLPPTLTFRLAHQIIGNKNSHLASPQPPQKDLIFEYCQNVLAPQISCDYYIFGHLHHPYSQPINAISTYYNLGDWVHHFTYGTFDGTPHGLYEIQRKVTIFIWHDGVSNKRQVLGKRI
eukprot:gene275-360_t